MCIRDSFSNAGEGLWRRTEHTKHDGNLYPTHGLGPVANYMGIQRGDRFAHLVSMSTPHRGLEEYRKAHLKPDDPRFGEDVYKRQVQGRARMRQKPQRKVQLSGHGRTVRSRRNGARICSCGRVRDIRWDILPRPSTAQPHYHRPITIDAKPLLYSCGGFEE